MEKGKWDAAPIFLYTHWNGYERKEILRNALERGKGRWTDSSYLARIIFCEMVQADVMGETGYGISTTLCDNSYPLLCVSIDDQKVREREASKDATGKILSEWTFEEFLALEPVSEDSEE